MTHAAIHYPKAHPERRCDWALFLDVDGTLLDIAKGPEEVHVPARARHALQMALERENGAVALVSGRPIRDLDRLFAPLRLPAAGIHGLERRDARGQMAGPSGLLATGLPPAARDRIVPLVNANRGLELEDKRCSLAVHFRMAPHLEPQVRRLFGELQQALGPGFQVLTGKYCLEIQPAAVNQGSAIEAFMREAPFAGRLPVFVGDDDTDEDGFEAVNRLGGLSIRVGHRPGTAAQWRLANVNAVLAWLQLPRMAHARPSWR